MNPAAPEDKNSNNSKVIFHNTYKKFWKVSHVSICYNTNTWIHYTVEQWSFIVTNGAA